MGPKSQLLSFQNEFRREESRFSECVEAFDSFTHKNHTFATVLQWMITSLRDATERPSAYFAFTSVVDAMKNAQLSMNDSITTVCWHGSHLWCDMFVLK